MNYLTIEKFGPQSKTVLIKKVLVGLILLVVPFIGLATWALYDIESPSLTDAAQVAEGDDVYSDIITVLR